MSESEHDLEREILLGPILDLLESAGYVRSQDANTSVSDMLVGGLAWCISVTGALSPEFQVLSDHEQILQDKIKSRGVIEAALKSIGCPYPLQAHQIQDLDCEKVYPVVQWVVNWVQTETNGEVSHSVHTIKEEELTLQQLEEELTCVKTSINIQHTNLNEQNQKSSHFLNEVQCLHEQIDKEGAIDNLRKLMPLLESLKALERQESTLQSRLKEKCPDLKVEVIQLEERTFSSNKCRNLSKDLNHSSCDSVEKLIAAKNELAAKLRAVLLLKRQLDDLPAQAELIQYERRFSELYVQIQEKLRQTRKFYATYNALLEIKELMLKETSLLNSILSQFENAIITAAGRVKLSDSMEGIMNGMQQKLQKVQLGLQAEHKVCDALKEKYIAAVAEQRRCSSLLKAFQEECAKNERLRNDDSSN